MAATITDLANGASTTSDQTLTTNAAVTGTVTDGDWFVVLIAASNDGTNGVASLTGATDSGGVNVYTQRALITYDPGAAGAGATLGIWTCQVTSAITNGTISATFSADTSQKAIQVYRVRPAAGESVAFVACDTTGITSTATVHAAPTVSVTSGHTIFGAASIETDDTITGDSDTTNGNWSAIITQLADGGADASCMCISSQYKTVTATGNQSWACTNPISGKDSARTYLVLKVQKAIVADAGSYAVTGTNANLKHGFKVAPDSGAYAVTGTNATTRKGLKVVPDSGSYALTGTNAALKHAWKIVPDSGSYALTGTDAATLHGWKVAPDSGSYSITGSDVTLTLTANNDKTIETDAGSYSVSGTDASLLHAWKVVPDVGSYAISGTDATLRRNLPIVPDAGSYAITGTNAATLHSWKVAAAAGSYSISGTDAALILNTPNKSIIAENGSYLVTGSDVSLVQIDNKDIVAESGSYLISGNPVSLTIAAQQQPRGELPIETEERSRRRKEGWEKARRARDKLKDMMTALYEGKEYIDPDEVEEAEADAISAFNMLQAIPEIPVAQLRALDDLIRNLQSLMGADRIAQNELQIAVDLSYRILKKKDEEDAIIALLLMG